jgi:hypothetical protein
VLYYTQSYCIMQVDFCENLKHTDRLPFRVPCLILPFYCTSTLTFEASILLHFVVYSIIIKNNQITCRDNSVALKCGLIKMFFVVVFLLNKRSSI